MADDNGLISDAISEIADQLCFAVKGEFNFTVRTPSSNEVVQKLSMLINFVLDSARRSLEEINEKNEKLATLDKMKSTFLANVSHELRTPLTLIMGPLEILLKDVSLSLPPVHMESLRRIQRNAARLFMLVSQILDFSKIEAGKYELHIEVLDLNKVVGTLVDDAQGLAISNKVTLKFIPDNKLDAIWLDKNSIEKIIGNLLINAIKYTQEGGHIEVRLEKNKQAVMLQVKDTGVGIPPEQLPRLFERFHQADSSSTRKHEGTGIGLALVSELVKLMDGHITVNSELGKGSQFIVSLPVSTPGVESENSVTNAETQDKEAGLKGSKVSLSQLAITHNEEESTTAYKVIGKLPLIVLADDNADLRAYLISLLKNDYEIISAINGKQALEMVRTYHPELVLSDVMMPIMDGYQLTKAIKEDETIKNIPVILITAKTGGEALVESFEVGANDYLSKPFSHEELLARTRSAIKGYTTQKEILQLNTVISEANQHLLAEIEVRKKLEEENAEKALMLSHAGRLASMGEMATGVAHELNQPLSIIHTNLQSLECIPLDQLSENDMKEIVSSSIHQVERAAKIISHMRTFARLKPATGSAIDLIEPTNAALGMFNEQFRLHEIEIICNFQQNIPLFAIESQQMEQLVVNLLSNARYAVEKMQEKMGKKYRMQIILNLAYLSDSEQICFEVIDNGIGMEAETLERCCEPFFTTKDIGEGTGLGLALVHSTVVNLKGNVQISSEPDRGSTIRLLFPAKSAS
ncbi:MAG: response regulator [Legionellales bacterium]|nr:response regulator [Legionellales bacterium]